MSYKLFSQRKIKECDKRRVSDQRKGGYITHLLPRARFYISYANYIYIIRSPKFVYLLAETYKIVGQQQLARSRKPLVQLLVYERHSCLRPDQSKNMAIAGKYVLTSN